LKTCVTTFGKAATSCAATSAIKSKIPVPSTQLT
jgi:hypothetical protein